MKRKGIILMALFGLLTTLLPYNIAAEEEVTFEVDNIEVEENSSASRTLSRGVGETIAATFPDANLAQGVADAIAGAAGAGDVNTVLTQAMIDTRTTFQTFLRNKNIVNLEGIEVFVNLTSLDISQNKITSLPDSIGNLTNLTYFYGISNQLTTFPDTIGNLTKLRALDFESNLFTTLPDSFCNLTELRDLDVSEANLTSLPENFGNLVKLSSLEIQRNKIASLPDSFVNLTALTTLFAGGNQLTSFPTGFGNFPSLVVDQLEDNLLPSDFATTVSGTANFTTLPQRTLVFQTGLTAYTINTEADLEDIDLNVVVELSAAASPRDDKKVSSAHTLILDEFTDAQGSPVVLTDYIKNGIVQKTGSVFAKARATGTGVFPNNSPNALTTNQIELAFQRIEYNLTFDLNGATGQAPAGQQLIEGEAGVSVTAPTRTGYTFKGWNTAQDGTGVNWQLGTTTMGTANVVLYAQWQQQVTPTTNPITTPTPTLNPGRTCQDDGYPKGYDWNGTACVLQSGYKVPNTGVK